MKRAIAAAKRVFANASLRRVVVAYALFVASEYGAWISILVWAYDRGGSVESGAIALAQLVPAAVAAPLFASVADRRSPATLLIGGYLLQAGALAATAVAAAAGASVLVWLFAIVASTSVVTTRPAQAALLPGIVHRVEELGAGNATLGWVESAGVVLAGAFTGVVIGAFGASAGIGVSAVLAAAAAVSALAVRRVKRLAAEGEATPTFREQLVVGITAARESDAARLLLGLQTATWVVVGALDILLVVLALRILDAGAGWVGYLNAAAGAGGLVAGLVAAAVLGVRRLAVPIVAAAVILSGSLGVLAVVSSTAAALTLLTLVGAGRVFFDVATRTLIQRIVPADVLGRVFGLVEGLSMAGLALGSVLAPFLVWAVGPRAAFAGVAVVLPLVGVAAGRRLLLLDRTAHVPIVEIALLRKVPIFQWLPGPSIETAAGALVPTEFAAGDVLIREGDVDADRFFAIASGEIDVFRGGTHVARLGRGEGVGEMALLRAVPRTATVVALTDVLVYALDRESFLIAVTGHAATTGVADSVVDTRFSELRELGLMSEDAD